MKTASEVSESSIYLASRSPRRREILAQLGICFDLLLVRDAPGRLIDIDETPCRGEMPADYVVRLAREKASISWGMLSRRGWPEAPVLSADTTVSIDGRIIGKPMSPEDAYEILQGLSGRVHQVFTGVAVRFEARLESVVSTSHVRFTTLSRQVIKRYVESGEPLDKAGAYGIQGKAAAFVESMTGTYTGVVGLPAFETLSLLSRLGIQTS